MADQGDVLDRVTDLLEDKTNTTRTRVTPWVGFVLSEMKQAGLLGPDSTTTISLVASTASYNLPSDLDILDSVYIEDNSRPPLIFVPEWDFAKFLADDDDREGTPEYYTLPSRNTGGVTPTIRLYPVPDAVETLRVNYKANFATLSSESDVLELKDDVFSTAVWGCYRIWARILEDQDVNKATEEFRVSLARAKWAQYGRADRPYLVKADLI